MRNLQIFHGALSCNQLLTQAVSGVGNAASQLKPGSFVMGFFLDYPDCQQPVVMGTLFSEIKKVTTPGTQENRDRINAAPISEPNQGTDATTTQQPAEQELLTMVKNKQLVTQQKHHHYQDQELIQLVL